MDGCKDLAMWFDLQEGGPSDRQLLEILEELTSSLDLVPDWIQSQSLMISRAEYGLSNKLLFLSAGLAIDFG